MIIEAKKLLINTIFIVLFPITLSCQKAGEKLIYQGAELEVAGTDYKFTEGPAVDSEGNVFFTDQPNNRILKWSAIDGAISTFMEPAGRANGLFFDHDGNLLAAADEKFELWRIDKEKNVTVLLDEFQGKKFNGPNDIWVAPDGGIYFTDPYYQRPYWERQEKEMDQQQVYYVSPDMGEVSVAASGFVQPNGIVGSADGKTLYIADIGDKKTYVYTINEDHSLSNKKLFCELGSDGMTLDDQGNVYLTGKGVTVFNTQGVKILHIPVPQPWTANVTFGGKNQNILFITAMNAVYTLQMNVKGIR
ncbi:SMP-30/gluconolactonase/LRE family protein [Muriicola sp. Z0-33]|uniref:SMP-30/gluconolactonase/LRE family protein n=1 Tax=Muriicola sp. Z0-33 TaxID=2816957 RepID=UPI002237D635|nr:SMP-30/gluconolactonase/LRE family protein [Muriicola sp. Z0-33]MCW5515939.1 SMP-30/gluconolactonase/LRE family protein [Muriicola sp. Z0-33]